jgi:hypothetical protein
MLCIHETAGRFGEIYSLNRQGNRMTCIRRLWDFLAVILIEDKIDIFFRNVWSFSELYSVKIHNTARSIVIDVRNSRSANIFSDSESTHSTVIKSLHFRGDNTISLNCSFTPQFIFGLLSMLSRSPCSDPLKFFQYKLRTIFTPTMSTGCLPQIPPSQRALGEVAACSSAVGRLTD